MPPLGKLRVGVDLGGTKIQVALMNRKGTVLATDRRMTPTTGTPETVTNAIADSIRAAIQTAGSSPAALTGIGVGAPGQIDFDHGTVSHAGNLPGWMGTYSLGPELSSRLGGIPVALGNDVQVAVNAELQLGSGRGFNSLIGVFCGTGIGGGLIVDRNLWLGRGAAGEIGHMVVKADGAKCTCGRRGCMEAYGGRAAMELRARKLAAAGHHTSLFTIMENKGRTRLSSGVWAKALASGDPLATKLINRAIWAIGAGVASAVNLTDVEAVIIGGGLGCRLGQAFVDRIHESMLPHLVMPTRPPAVLLAQLGDLGGAVGAGLLVDKIAKLPPAAPGKTPLPGAKIIDQISRASQPTTAVGADSD